MKTRLKEFSLNKIKFTKKYRTLKKKSIKNKRYFKDFSIQPLYEHNNTDLMSVKRSETLGSSHLTAIKPIV